MSGTAQPSVDAGTKAGQGKPPGSAGMAAEDLNLIDDNLDDVHKEPEEIWAELDAAEGAAPPDKGAAAEQAAAPASKEGAAAEGGELPASEATPAGKPEAGEGQPPAAEAPQVDWSKAPPELRAAHEALVADRARLEQSERSQRGRVSAMQRQLDELQRRPPGAPAAADPAAAPPKKGTFTTEKGKAFAGEYPEVAGAVAEEIETVKAELAEAKEALRTVAEDREKAVLAEQLSILEAEHSDWRTVAAKGSGFKEWVTTQPRHIREAAARNAKVIVDAEEAADLIGRFKEFRSEQEAQRGLADKGQQEAPEGQDPPQGGQGQRESTGTSLSGKRQRQLSSSAGARSQGPGAAQGIPEDGSPEEIWAAFDRKEAAERQARRA